MGNPWEPQWISTTWNAVNHRVHSLDLSPLPLPFSNGRAEHAALRDAVSTYSRCLTFSIRMKWEIKVRGGKNTIRGRRDRFEFFSHIFFFFGNTLRVCMTEERISRTCNVDNNCARWNYRLSNSIECRERGFFPPFDTAFVRSFYTRPIGETDDAHRCKSTTYSPRRIYFI